MQVLRGFPKLGRMRLRDFAFIFALFCTVAGGNAQQADPHQVDILEEKVSRLTAQVEDVQFRQQQIQKDIDGLKTQLQEVRRAAGGVDSSELKALEDRIAAVDAARQADKKAIIDQLSKELAGLGTTKSTAKPAPTPTPTGEHVVAKGETLTTIAKANGVSVADLKKANGLTGNDIKVGQKLLIPK